MVSWWLVLADAAPSSLWPLGAIGASMWPLGAIGAGWWTLGAAEAPPAGGEGGGFGQLLIVFGPMILAFLIINHFLVTRPQQRQQVQHADMLGKLKKNDRVLTAGGIIGTFVLLSDDKSEVTLRVDDNTRLKFRAEYVRGVLDAPAAESSSTSKPAS